MKKLLFLISLLPSVLMAGLVHQGPNKGAITPVATGASITPVQSSCTAHSPTSPVSLKFKSSVKAGNTIVVQVADSGNAMASGDVVDNKGNSKYTMRPEGGAGDASARVGTYVSTNIATGGTNFISTITISGGPFIGACLEEWSGVTAFDQSNTATGTNSAVVSGNVTTSVQTLFLGAMTHSSGGTTLTETNGETLIAKDENNSQFQTFSFVYKIQSATTDQMKWTAGASVAYKATVVTLK